MVSNTTPTIFNGITGAGDESTITVSPVAVPRIDEKNDCANVLVDSGAPGHHFDDAIILELRNKLEHYQALGIQLSIATPRRYPLKGAGEGLLRGHVIDAKGVQQLIELST